MARKRGRPQIALPLAKAPTLDPEGAPDGPKRTPISFADAYNGREAYKVEKILAQVTRKGVEHYILKLLIRSPCAAPAAAANRRATVQPRKSIVWNYFSKKFRGEDGYLYSTCSLCRTTMASCNTTNLINPPHPQAFRRPSRRCDGRQGRGGFNKPDPVAEAVKLTKLPDDVKRDYDAAAVKWIVKSCMPHSITERDQYLREFLKMILEMSVENILQLKEEIEDLQKERLSVSLAADIWGENGISILAIMAYWITPDFELKEKLLLAKPFSQGITYGPVAQMLAMMEATSVPTFSYVMPMFGSLHAAMDEDATAVALIDGEVNPINDDGTYFDLLAWWKAKQTIFPHLSKMARQFHAFPATSAYVERLFSAASRMHNDFKKSTSETTLEHALIVYNNLD
eukprot:jgi/Tetstr1/443482/TSEL_031490.t1